MLQPSAADLSPDAPSVGMGYIARRAGVAPMSVPSIVRYVRLLIANDGFPPPLPRYILSTGQRALGVTYASRWIRAAVDAWFDGLIPPELADAAAAAAAARDAATLDERAMQIAA